MAGLALLGEGAARAKEKLSLRHVAAEGLAFGIAANVVALRFVPAVVARITTLGVAVGWAALLLLAAEQGLRWGVTAAVHVTLARRGVPGWWAFATGVLVGTFVPAVFPWTPAGGVTPIPELVQLAEVWGERGVTFLMALSSALLASAVGRMMEARGVRAGRWLLAAAVALPLATFVHGRLRLGAVESQRDAAPTMRVALVQPSTSARDRWDPDHATRILANLTAATREAEQRGAELTVWPEAAYPFGIAHVTRRCPIGSLAILPFGVRGPVLTGVVTTGGNGDLWNSAAVCRTDGSLGPPQDKLHLLWFGETIPYLDRLPWVRSKFTRGIGLVPGTEIVLQRAGRARASVLNCFEDTLPGAGREAMTQRPNLLVNVTNDAWFEGSSESELHMRLAALRAVESRRDLVRAVNLGVTSWIDAAGVVRARVDGTARATVMADAALLETEPTLFDRFGDAPLALLALLVVATTLTAASMRGDGLTG